MLDWLIRLALAHGLITVDGDAAMEYSGAKSTRQRFRSRPRGSARHSNPYSPSTASRWTGCAVRLRRVSVDGSGTAWPGRKTCASHSRPEFKLRQ